MTGVSGQVAVVTGGSRGIGLAAARALGAQGATVILIGRDPGAADMAAGALQEEGIDADLVQAVKRMLDQ